MRKFPTISGQNLQQESKTIPKDLAGKWKLFILAFRRWHQNLVDSWVPGLEKLQLNFPDFLFYELPTMSKGYQLMSFMIDGGMRAGIPDPIVRARTLTVYLKRRSFMELLGIPNAETIYLFLVSEDNDILWTGEGGFQQDQFDAVASILKQQI